MPIGREFDARTYRGLGPHPSDPRAAAAAAEIVALIEEALPGSGAEHVGSTAVPGVAGKNIIDVQITADPADVPRLTRALLAIGFVEQTGPDPWPPERPMLEGTYRVADAVFGIHCHIVPTTDPDVRQMIEFRDLLRSDPAAREAYARIKRELARQTEDPLAYTHGKTDVIRRLLADRRPTT
jgi:dephospho-CoA kinase